MAVGHIVKAGDQVAQRGLAAAGRTDQGQILPRADLEIDMAQDFVVIVGVLKADILKLDAALSHNERFGIGGVGDIHRRVHDFVKALNAGHAPLELLGKFHNAADGGDEGGDIEDVRHQITGADPPVNQEEPASHNDDQIHEAVKQPGGGVEGGHEMVGGLFDLLERPVSGLKLFLFPFLGGKGLDDPLAQKAVLHGGVELADLIALAPESRPQLQVEGHRDNAHQGNAGKYDEGQGYTGRAQDHKGGSDLDGRDEEFLRTVVGKFGHVKQVVGDASHDLADLGVGIVGVAQPLEMGKGVPPHVGLDVDAHDVAGAGHVVVGGAVNKPKNQVQYSQFEHDPGGQGNGGIGGGVGQIAHDLRQHNVAQGGQRRAEQIKEQNAPVSHQIRHEPRQHGLFGNLCRLV